MNDVSVGFVGMTHLGLVSATACASKGFRTICVDQNAKLIAALSAGVLPVNEPGLSACLARNGARQLFSSQLDSLLECDVIYVAPDVPTDDTGASDLSAITELISQVTFAARHDAILVVLSQVPPGFTANVAWPTAQRFYQVETLVFGRALERAMEPERYIIGCASPKVELPSKFAAVLRAYGCPILPMRYESAELAKISINMCLVSSISVANTLAALCEQIGADWAEIAPALRLDRRIGAYSYLKPGLGIAGGNLERDLATVIELAAEHDVDAAVVKAWQSASAIAKQWAVRRVRSLLPILGAHPQIALWGLAYKENTHSTKNSPSLATIAAFPTLRFQAYDPVVEATRAQHPSVTGYANPLAALEDACALLILTPWPEFTAISARDIATRLNGSIVIDPYAVLDARACIEAGLDYHTLGVAALNTGEH